MTKRGFALLHPDELREISRAAGKAAHKSGKAHTWTSDEAREAGRKGGAKGGKRKKKDQNA